MRISLFLGFWLLLAKASLAQTAGINLGGYEYPFPVRYHTVSEEVKMAYLVVDPETAANGRTVVLLHVKNFNGSYWEETADGSAREPGSAVSKTVGPGVVSWTSLPPRVPGKL